MTLTRKCALCDHTLTAKNKTKEHIIPNAIGGRKKTTGFICNDCNNKLGENWDSELARQLNWFSLAVGISRERGEPPKQIVQTIEGDRYWLLNDGSFTPEKSSYSEEDIGGKIKIDLTAKTIEEAKQRIKGIARKYPKFDVEKAFSELEVKTNYLDSPLHVSLSLGGADAGRSLVKTAFAFASECGVPHLQCEKALEYLLDLEIETFPFGFAYLSDLVENRPKDKIFHCVSLHGDPKKKRLWSYIEYFGIFRLVVLLSDAYGGPYKSEVYAINPISGERIGLADGDARRLINLLEQTSTAAATANRKDIDGAFIDSTLAQSLRRFDKGGDAFYDQISALHKSVRGSNPDAALYWFCRMLDGGADPRYLARRIVRMAWEDIGLADPRAAQIAGEAAATYERLGSPEGELALAEAVLYLAMAAKSNAAYVAYNAARSFIAKDASRPVPVHLRNAPTRLMKELDYGKHYRYAHDETGGYAAGENYFPDGMPSVNWYQPVERGLEIKIGEKLAHLRELDRQAFKVAKNSKKRED